MKLNEDVMYKKDAGVTYFYYYMVPDHRETQFETQTLTEAPVLYYAVPVSVHKCQTQ